MEIIIVGSSVVSLMTLAGLHVYWALGGRWPGSDSRSLARLVVGADAFPSTTECLAVAAALFGVALLALDSVNWISIGAPRWLHIIAVGGAATVLALRGVGGYVEERFRPAVLEMPYLRWNRVLYSPLCLGLAALVGSTLGF